MTSPDPAPLTAEEQALAQRLARLGPHAEPSPALDARVLAAAHAATAVPVTTQSRRRRWPAALGLAASLVLAVGLAWRLRPLPEPPPAPRAAPEAGNTAAPAAPAVMQAPMPSAAPAPEPEVANDAAAREVAPPARAAATPGIVLESPPSPRATPVDQRSAAKVAATAAIPVPPAPPPPEALRDVAAPAPAAPPATEAIAPQSATHANEAEQAVSAGDNRQADEPTDEVPPATVDSPAVRDAWLQRIHRLVDAGDITGARASLREFARRYPDYPLPEDLRALEQ